MKSEGRLPSGFTLIELLAVIAITAVLMGIIMPALHRAREMGRRAVCLNNTKSLALAWTLHCSDHDGTMDEFRIYNRALSASDVRYLAGDR
jgi:prepilin-type N-terminal cleavage/methylation domain-containing protein